MPGEIVDLRTAIAMTIGPASRPYGNAPYLCWTTFAALNADETGELKFRPVRRIL